uniref:Uncharacterized protein n=1 Tax=Manihot esculenta TaxID=3983 RepID=A0A2C9U7B3_MANES
MNLERRIIKLAIVELLESVANFPFVYKLRGLEEVIRIGSNYVTSKHKHLN